MTTGALDLLKLGSAPPAILETLPGRDNEGVPGAWKELESTRWLLTNREEPELESENLEFFIVLEDEEEEEEPVLPFTEPELLILAFDTSLLLVPAGFVTLVESLELLLRNPKFLKLLPALDDMMVCARRIIRPSGVQWKRAKTRWVREKYKKYEWNWRKIKDNLKKKIYAR